MKNFTVLDLLDLDLKERDSLNLKCISGRPGLVNTITTPNMNRPGLALSGFFEEFGNQRVQIFGQGENAYLLKMGEEQNFQTIQDIFQYTIPACIFTHNNAPPDWFIKIAEKAKCPILITDIPTTEFSSRFIRALDNVFAPKKTIHGVLVEVSGRGVLITGDSGVGKSETALELIERGHRLVADDAVEIRCTSGNILEGSGTNRALGHHMEIRGLGIINVAHLFGVGAIRDVKQVQMVVHLEEWDNSKTYERLGQADATTDILGVSVPYLLIPVKPGRNIPIIIETAAMNERLKRLGYYSAKEFNQNVLQWLESENARTLYLQRSDLENT
ncbi:HPr(Ser) kinase/phosphatase [Spirochaeta cellobiosiphila]|uniref:HPr(Ser) kinase/phosphatase n=1 Tax=Spirochaeta cellobiosiphila TaxID=504483 RepID=UPI000401B079|nr:HPr(Ser) kinase/phosphatase [Spirochaeta cellobiosiphila]